MSERLHNGRKFRMLTVIEEYSCRCLAIRVDYHLKSEQVLEALAALFVTKGISDYIRSDNGAEFTAKQGREWLAKLDVKIAYITLGSPWENGFNERFNGSLRDELFNSEMFYPLAEAKLLIENWRKHYNEVRPHSALGYQPPAPNAIITQPQGLSPHSTALHASTPPAQKH